MYRCAPATSSSADPWVRFLVALSWVVWVIAPRTASAHQASVSHARAEVSDDRTRVDYELLLAPPDVAESLGLAADATPTDGEVQAGAAKLADYVFSRVRIRGGGASCQLAYTGPGLGASVRQGPRLVAVAARLSCAGPMTELVIEYDLFFDLDALHRNFLTVRHRGEQAVVELDAEESRFVWELGRPPPSGLAGFVKSGVEHIALGYDHIAFLLGLLLVVTIVRGTPRADEGAAWRVRDLWSGLRYTAAIVTSFTVAHSLTLIAASLGWIALSSRVVESLIAASIIYVAVENIAFPQTRYRWLVTFAFGLMHGMGFASMLQVMLPPEDVIWPLLAFNVGVELGQLAIVILFLPLLTVFTRAIGPRRYREWFLTIASGLLALLGVAWLLERLVDVVIIGL